jgi:hypothetical protein
MSSLSYEECRDIEKTHVCAECRGILVTRFSPTRSLWEVVCGEDQVHVGFQRELRPVEAYKAGIRQDPVVEAGVKRRLERHQPEGLMGESDQLYALVPHKDAGSDSDLTTVQRDQIIFYSRSLDLDPRFGHLVLYYGKPYVTEAGLLYHAHRSKRFQGMTSRPLDAEERESYMIAEGEHAWIAKVFVEGVMFPFTGLGRAREDPEHPIARGSVVEPQHPQRMAERRAEMQALRKAFPLGLPVLEESEGDNE